MTFLDDRVTFLLSGQDITGHNEGMYQYILYRRNISGSYDRIFIGNFYYNGTDTSIRFDVTDIIVSDGFVVKEDDILSAYESDKVVINKILNKYYVQVVWDGEGPDISTSSLEWVAKVYKYPNKSLSKYMVFYSPDSTAYQNNMTIAMQGFSISPSEDSVLIPHYPMFADEQSQEINNCPFGISLICGSNISGLTFTFSVEEEDFSKSINISGNSITYMSNVGNVASFRDVVPTNDGVLSVSNGTLTYKAAILDVCPKRYYLFWQDRYGSFQCQGFNEYANYSETIDRTEVQDYQNRRRNSNIQVESKWNINSGWIKEEIYPYYESIYTSQILMLYDFKQDKVYSVLVSGDYEEKTYRNQKKMINMNLVLTENKKQNIIY